MTTKVSRNAIKNTRRYQLAGAIFLCSVILLTSLITAVNPWVSLVGAAGASEQDIIQIDVFDTFTGKCLSGLELSRYLTTAEYQGLMKDQRDYGFKKADGSIYVSSKADKAMGGDGDFGSSLRCETVLKKLVPVIFGSRTEFLKMVFITDNVVEAEGKRAYLMKSIDGCTDVDSCSPKHMSRIREIIKNWVRSQESQHQAQIDLYSKQVTVSAFEACYSWGDPANIPTDTTKYDKSRYVRNANPNSGSGGFWIFKGTGGDSYLNELPVGETVESYIRGGSNDGKVTCDEVFSRVAADKLLDLDADQEQEDILAQEKFEDIMGIFLTDGTNILHACVAANTTSSLKDQPTTTLMQTIAGWLSRGGTGGIDISVGSMVNSTTDEEAQKIGACLTENYGEKLQTVLDKEPSDFDPEAGENTENGGDGAANEPTCESEGGALGWILCKVLELGDHVMSGLDSAVSNLLEVPKEFLTDDGLRDAWGNLRNIAYMILVPIALVMVVGTALGFEFISAYTIKRALPRLVVATIFIALSFEITAFLVDMTNNIGKGIGNIITGAFGSGDVSLITVFNPPAASSTGANAAQVAGAGIGVTALVIGAGFGILATGSLGILVSYVFIAVVALTMAFFLLSLRQALIVFLMIMAPVAILAWIFPGNDKLWKLWWSSFSKLLLLYPLIMILVASGKSFAQIVPGSGLVDTLIRIVAYFGPYFMIPAMFKFAGGIFATVSNMANNREKGLFDRQKKYRGRKASENWRDTKAGDKAWRPRSFNNLGERMGVGVSGRFGFGGKGRAAVQTQRRENAAERMAKDESLKQLALASDDGNAVMALSGGTNAGARAAAEDLRQSWLDDNAEYQGAVRSGDMATQRRIEQETQTRANQALLEAQAVGVNRSRSQAAFSTMAQNKARAIAGGAAGRNVVERGLGRLHGESGANAGALDETRQAMAFFARSSGRADLGSPSTTMDDRQSVIDGFDRAGASAVAHGYAGGTEAVANALTEEYQEALANGDEVRAVEAASKMVGLRNAMTQQTPEENKASIVSMLQGVGVDLGSDMSVDQQLGAQIAPTAAYTGPLSPQQRAASVTNHIRNRAGLWERGTDPRLLEQNGPGNGGQNGP